MPSLPLTPVAPVAFDLALEPRHCVGPPDRLFMFGGVGLGASLQALESVTGRPPVWATAQYESYARPGETVRFTVSERVRGNQVSQARVTATAGDREILAVLAALGRRDVPEEGQWTKAPAAPAPLDCPVRPHWPGRHPDDLHGKIEVRIARGGMHGPGGSGTPSPGGGSLIWARPADGSPIDRAFVAIVADYVPSGIGPALGRNAGGNSLDNSIRFHRWVETPWLLGDIRIHGVAHGFAHGRMHLFAETGELIATASQSLILRLWEPPAPALAPRE